MMEQDYHDCPFYGEKRCCGDEIDEFINRVQGLSINLIFNNGQKINIHPWVITEVVDYGNSWVAMRQNTPEYLTLDVSRLTLGSRYIYSRYHHWGKLTVMKRNYCPLK